MPNFKKKLGKNNQGKIFIAKNRNGPDGLIFPASMETRNVKIKILEQTDETIEEIAVKTAKDQLMDLKEKYKKHKLNGGADNGKN